MSPGRPGHHLLEGVPGGSCRHSGRGTPRDFHEGRRVDPWSPRRRTCWAATGGPPTLTARSSAVTAPSGRPASWRGGRSTTTQLVTSMMSRDTVHLDVSWMNPGVGNMTQSTVWVSGWGIEIPWVGMATEACPFLDLGTGCRPAAQVHTPASALLVKQTTKPGNKHANTPHSL